MNKQVMNKSMIKAIRKHRNNGMWYYVQETSGLFGDFNYGISRFSYEECPKECMDKVFARSHGEAVERLLKRQERLEDLSCWNKRADKVSAKWAKWKVISEEHIDNEEKRHPQFFN